MKHVFLHPTPLTAFCMGNDFTIHSGDVIELTPAQKRHELIKGLLQAAGNKKAARLEPVYEAQQNG
jgi:hypothetical protein